jgi:three-Cys-motif partner protein
MSLHFDAVGRWSEIKIEILRKYVAAYSTVLAKHRLHRVYIDAFSGPGEHRRKHTGEHVEGSPLAALSVQPRFDHYYFIDLASAKIDHLRGQIGERPDVDCFVGDSNAILLNDIFPRVRFERYQRGLCFLDPYGLHLNWTVIAAAGAERGLEIVLNFPVADMNRNVFWHNYEAVDAADITRMNAFWGDENWRDVAYTTATTLFQWKEKTDNETVADAFRTRLRKVAGFTYVPEPLPMKNDQGAVVYYLFFASHNATANKIMNDILKKYRK